MEEKEKLRRREPITDTQLLMTITICIFVGMYVLAILIWGGGFKKPQMLFDMLNDNAYLVIIRHFCRRRDGPGCHGGRYDPQREPQAL